VGIYQREAREVWSRAITEAAAAGEILKPFTKQGTWTTLTWRKGWVFILLIVRMKISERA
jgi:hypothetical protein